MTRRQTLVLSACKCKYMELFFLFWLYARRRSTHDNNEIWPWSITQIQNYVHSKCCLFNAPADNLPVEWLFCCNLWVTFQCLNAYDLIKWGQMIIKLLSVADQRAVPLGQVHIESKYSKTNSPMNCMCLLVVSICSYRGKGNGCYCW